MRIHGVDRVRDKVCRIGIVCERMNKMMFVFNSIFHSNGLWNHYRNFHCTINRSDRSMEPINKRPTLHSSEEETISKRLSSANSNNQLNTKWLHVSIKQGAYDRNEVCAHDRNQLLIEYVIHSLAHSLVQSTFNTLILSTHWHEAIFLEPFRNWSHVMIKASQRN